MSKNFELLRRLGKDELLFQVPIAAPLLDNPSACPDAGPVWNEPIEFDNTEPRWRGHGLSAQEQEEFAKLVRRVFAFQNAHAPRAVTFCGVEGTAPSGICLHAGEFLAAQGAASVCMVDGNLRAPSLHLFSGVPQSPGLADATSSPGPIKEFAVRIAPGNLWILPSGSWRGGAPDLLASQRLRLRIAELRRAFHYVLIDAPPLSSYEDAIVLGQMADGVILVVEANSTRRETARRAKEALETANVNVFGAILNNRTYPIPEALYRRL